MEANFERHVCGVREKVKTYRLKSRFWSELGKISFFQKVRGRDTGTHFFPCITTVCVYITVKAKKQVLEGRKKNTKLTVEFSSSVKKIKF